MMKMNDWDYDETPSICQRQGEKNERKEGQEGNGRQWGRYSMIWIRKELMEDERGVVRHNGDEQATKTVRPRWLFH